MGTNAYEIVLKKKDMMNIVSVFKKALLLGSQFVMVNDIIVIPSEHRKINGVHCIRHGIQLPTDEYSSIQYVSPEDIADILKTLTDAKGIDKIVMYWSEFFIDIELFFKDGLRNRYNLANSSVATHANKEMDGMLPKREEYPNIYESLSLLGGVDCKKSIIDADQLFDIAAGRVVEIEDHNGGIIRISKSLFPCIGVVKRGTVPDMDVDTTTYTKNGNNILAMTVRYKEMHAVHVYYYDPIMPETK